MGWLGSDAQWGPAARRQERARVAAFRRREASRRKQRAAARQEAMRKPVRTFIRWAAK